MERIVIYKKKFYRNTEAFIYRQVKWLANDFNVYLVADEFACPPGFDFKNVKKVVLNKNEEFIRRMIDSQFKRKSARKYAFYNVKQMSEILRREKIELIHAHFGMSALKILPIAKKYRIPLVVSFHGLDASSELLIKNYRKQLPSLFKYAAKIIVVSKHMVESLNLNNWMHKVILLPYSIDTEEFMPFPKNGSDGKPIRILHSGRIVPKKGVPDLIDVFANLYRKDQRVRLTIIGDGPELEYCRQKTFKFLLQDAIEFLGVQPISVVKEMMNEADIFVLNSRTDKMGNMEGTPVSILEAMCMAKAVVSTCHAGIPYVIKNGYNGIVVPERDKIALEEALSSLIANKAYRIELGENARKTIIEQFSSDQILPCLSKTLKAVIETSVEFNS